MAEKIQSVNSPAKPEVVSKDEIADLLNVLKLQFPNYDWPFVDRYLQHAKIIKLNDKFLLGPSLPPFPSKAFERFIGRNLKSPEYPIITAFAVTNQCHGICSYCSYSELGDEDMSTEEIIKIISELQDLGVSVIALTGGEPLRRNDLEKIISSVDDRSVAVLATSGDTLNSALTKEKALAFKQAGLFNISIPLDHPERKMNDKMRYDGAYDISINTIQNCLEAGLYTITNIVITENNFDDLWNYIYKMQELGVHSIRVIDKIPSGNYLNITPLSFNMRKKLVEIHKTVNADPNLPQISVMSYAESPEVLGCGAGGIHNMYVDGHGRLRPCDFIPINFGDLKKEPLIEVFKRMRKFFDLPANDCFMKKYGHVIYKALEGKKSIDFADIENLLSETRESIGKII